MSGAKLQVRAAAIRNKERWSKRDLMVLRVISELKAVFPP
jgi:hypothetical protein